MHNKNNLNLKKKKKIAQNFYIDFFFFLHLTYIFEK